MREPYLLLGVDLSAISPEHLYRIEQLMIDLELLLAGLQLTQLKMPGVYAAELPISEGRRIWMDVSILLSRADEDVGDDLKWFANLCDREGCELSFN